MSRIISQTKAAEIAGASRIAITKLKSTRSFFTDDWKVDTDHPDWKGYLRERKAKVRKKDLKENPETQSVEADDFAFRNFIPESISEEKIYADIQAKKIQLMQELDLLIEKKQVASAFGEISKNVQSNFVDLGRRISPRIASKLGLPGTEKTIEKEINEEVKKGIQNLISSIKVAIDKL